MAAIRLRNTFLEHLETWRLGSVEVARDCASGKVRKMSACTETEGCTWMDIACLSLVLYVGGGAEDRAGTSTASA